MVPSLPPARLARLAPTPSGYLHLGNALNFALTWLLARHLGAKLLLRIDDLDAERARPEYVEAIFRDLEWLGLDHDLGPTGPDDFWRLWSQTKRLDLYHAALATLAQAQLPGGQPLLFACTCSRAQVRAAAPDGQYPGTCRGQGLGSTPGAAWRLLTSPGTVATFAELPSGHAQVDVWALARDPVVRRRDGVPAYQVASVADDLHFGTDLVVRGLDLLPSTGVQGYLATWLPGGQALAQARYYHHPLVRAADGQKLAKSAGATSLREWRARHPTPARFYQALARLLHVPGAGEVAQIGHILPHFEPVNLPKDGGLAFMPEM
jgi:glutamyl-Q tRNA(Asp) synthetase